MGNSEINTAIQWFQRNVSTCIFTALVDIYISKLMDRLVLWHIIALYRIFYTAGGQIFYLFAVRNFTTINQTKVRQLHKGSDNSPFLIVFSANYIDQSNVTLMLLKAG